MWKVTVCAAALVCAACGGEPERPSLTGSWSISIAGACTGNMSLRQTNDSVSGTTACGTQTGTATGSVAGNSVSLTLGWPGYNDALMAGTFNVGSITGTVSGSGFNNQAFTASRIGNP